MFRLFSGFAVLLNILVFLGCSRGPEMVEVDGVLLVDGAPLEKIQVEFWPETDGPRSRGITDGQGRFTLKTDDGTRTGAMVGKHRVVLTDVGILGDKLLGRAGEDVDMAEGKLPRIADQYSAGQSTPLFQSVVSGKKNVVELSAKSRDKAS